MAIALASKPGLTGASALSIPKEWDATWFRGFINNLLKGGDVRNASGANGISVTGTIASPYATISIGGSGVTYPIILNPPAGQYALQINGTTFAALSFNASGATGNTSDLYLFQNTGAAGSGGGFLGTRNANALNFQTNATTRIQISGTGAITILAPTSGTALTINKVAGSNGVVINGTAGETGLFVQSGSSGANFCAIFRDSTGATNLFYIDGSGNCFIPSGSLTLSGTTTATTNLVVSAGGTGAFAAQFAHTGVNTVAPVYITSTAGVEAIRMDTTATTGAQTPAGLGAVKPGAAGTSASKWIPVNLDGTRYYIPAFL